MRRSSLNVNLSPSPPARFSVSGSQSPLTNPRPVAGGFIKTEAPAKINLFLDVLGKRPDGYHDIISVMQTVAVCDELMICAGEEGSSGIRLTCNDKSLPTDENNLAVKAAALLIREFDIPYSVSVELTKRIPAGAGLAGGSSDCAAVLRGMNVLFNLNIPRERLIKLGQALGADVPFCLIGGTAVAEGIGEKLTSLSPHPYTDIVIVCPGVHVSTAEVYTRLSKSIKPVSPMYLELMKNALRAKDNSRIAYSFYNAFTKASAEMHPVIAEIIAELKNTGALGVSMSGTGSAVFAYYDNANKARQVCDKFKKYFTFHTHPKGGLL